MQVSKSNDVKIYNLSAGKSLPQRSDVDIRRRVQLIQDFEMPCISSTIAVTPDGQFVYASGSYKPTLKCFELDDLSLKFERGLDAEVVKLLPLTEDYSKVVLLEEDRYLEFHARFGRYFRLRIPKTGRDMTFCNESSELYMVGAGNEVYRLNLEQGTFLTPLATESESLCCCDVNDWHQLFVTGGSNCTVEAWDHRDRTRVGILNCAIEQLREDALNSDFVPSITSVKFKDPLNLAVGTSTGHVLMYDLRAKSPKLVKNHNFALPIEQIDFVEEGKLAMSMDSRALKLWDVESGKPFAAIEPGTKLNDFVRYPGSGLVFFANDAPKMLQYFVPALGMAPKWCYYLDNITEELEESETPAIYDDYKFVSKEQLEEVGLSNLIGSNLLRAHMHGYFVDVRLYNKAKTLTQPFAFESYKDRKLQEKLDDERELSALTKKLKAPKVNKELASLLEQDLSLDNKGRNSKKKKAAGELLNDERFKDLFGNPDFEVDKQSEHYQKLAEKMQKLKERDVGRPEEASDDSEAEDEDMESSSAVEGTSSADASEQSEQSDLEQEEQTEPPKRKKTFKLVGLDTSRDFNSFVPSTAEDDPALRTSGNMRARRKQLQNLTHDSVVENLPFGGKSITFTPQPDKRAAEASGREARMQQHAEERRAVRRTAAPVARLLKPLPGQAQHWRRGRQPK